MQVKLPTLNKPIVEMFWVAEYNNGQALSQFDPFTRTENSYSRVDHKNVLRFWWLPITPKLTSLFPGTRYNPVLKRHAADTNGSKGFVARRTTVALSTGGQKVVHKVKCYVLGIEGGPRREIYPDGSIINKANPSVGETQDLLHG